MHSDTKLKNSFTRSQFLFVNMIYMIILLGIIVYVAQVFGDSFVGEDKVFGDSFVGVVVLLGAFPLILSLWILLRWKRTNMLDFIVLGVLVIIIFVSIPYQLKRKMDSEDYKFYLFSREVRKENSFNSVKLHKIPKNRKGVHHITGSVETEEDYQKLWELTEEYQVYGIDDIEISNKSRPVESL